MRRALWAFVLLSIGCPAPPPAPVVPPPRGSSHLYPPPPKCGGEPMVVRFYDVGQALSALIELPGNHAILVDAGDAPKRAGCGAACSSAHTHLMESLARDLSGKKLDLLFLTHQHSDHIGGAPDVIGSFHPSIVADNGTRASSSEVALVHDAASNCGAKMGAIHPGHIRIDDLESGAVRVRALVPASWPARCTSDSDGSGQNDCSIGLRLDYCASSAIFLGDAEREEEELIDPLGPATLLQVGHHGAETSSSPSILERVHPKIAVISAGKKDEGLNRSYCHPRAAAIERLNTVLGGKTSGSILAFDGAVRCREATPSNWSQVPASEHLYATPRDGDVVLITTGDGDFRRVR